MANSKKGLGSIIIRPIMSNTPTFDNSSTSQVGDIIINGNYEMNDIPKSTCTSTKSSQKTKEVKKSTKPTINSKLSANILSEYNGGDRGDHDNNIITQYTNVGVNLGSPKLFCSPVDCMIEVARKKAYCNKNNPKSYTA